MIDNIQNLLGKEGVQMKQALLYAGTLIVALLLSLSILPKFSLALSCAEPSSAAIAYDEYDAVLIGSVEKVEYTNEAKKMMIEVERSFKGADEEKIAVFEDVTWGESQENVTYLFFLNQEGEKWVHPLCSPTTQNTDLADEFFADRTELALQEVEYLETETNHTVLIILITLLLAAVVAGVLVTLRKERSKRR